jgi:hypothetical protein
MNLRFKFFNLALLISITICLPGYAQHMGDHDDGHDWHHGDGHYFSDSLETITVSGKIIVENTMMYPMYYLDENDDGQADYYLNFGPHWYQPDSSSVERPTHGEQITVTGGTHNEHMDNLQVIIVYEINDLFWRDPVAPTWNYMGGHHDGEGHHTGMGYGFGWMHDSVSTMELNGTVLTDTTFVYTQYYLDTDQNDSPDYYLNFGPPWYQPMSGAERPEGGEHVTIVGGIMEMHEFPMVLVYQIDGLVWRDSTAFGDHFGGGWMDRYMDQSRYFHSPFDSLDGMQVYPGWHGGMMGHGHGGMMSDRLFCQILEIFPQNIPFPGDHHILAGYEVALFNPDGSNNMWMDGMYGRHMNFNNNIDFRLHYNDIQLEGEGIDENSIKVKYWDKSIDSWLTVSSAVLDQDKNTVSFSSDEVANYVILTGDQQVTTSVSDEGALTINGFNLKQNYPNPFNPQTTIEFELQNSGFVTLKVYNVLGQKITTLINGEMSSGSHKVGFVATSLPSGVYYYSLESGGERIVRRMTLMK